MCNCIKELEYRLLNAFPERNKKKVISYSFPGGFLLNGERIYSVPLIQKIKDQEKTYEVDVTISYCPFCGEALRPHIEGKQQTLVHM